MKKACWFYLLITASGMIWNDACWASRANKSSGGYSGYTPNRPIDRSGTAYGNTNRSSSFSRDRSLGGQNHSFRRVNSTGGFFSPGRSVGRPNFAFGGAYRTGAFGYGGIYNYRAPRTRFFGGFSYGQPLFLYHRSFYRPFYRPFYDPFFSPANYPPVYPPVVVVLATLPIYIQQQPSVIRSAPPALVISSTNYWYYCD